MHKGAVYRYIDKLCKNDFEFFIYSGLYKKLVSLGYIVSYEEAKIIDISVTNTWKIIKPQQIPFISYPYEWCFSMLKDAALLTLQIQKVALEYGMSLKDASAFNIQFFNGKPVHIDTLSFEQYQVGKPWVGYRQFIEHFLSPLSLMGMVDVRLNRLSSVFLDGIPVDLTARLLPLKSRFNLSHLIHIFAHAKTQKRFANKKLGKLLEKRAVSLHSLLGMLDDLEHTVKKLKWNPKGTQWEDYYEEDKNNYDAQAMEHKAELVESFLQKTKAKIVWDMGANTGYFSAIAVKTGATVLSFDNDYGALEKNYHDVVKNKEEHRLPLFCDMTNPTPSVGWENEERASLLKRGPADAVLALALIHHLTISHNVPFSYLASCFSKMGKYLIIEFVDKQDSQIQILLANREDIFSKYSKQDFEEAFLPYFSIQEAVVINGSKRILYLMKTKR